MQARQEIEASWAFHFYSMYIIKIMHLFYPIVVVNQQNVYNGDKSCIYISRHTTHNWELLLGLFAINQYSKKIIRGLGHYLVYIMCPWYMLCGVVIGTRKNAEQLIKNNEYLFIIPGGGEEMTFGSENARKVYWYSKSRKYKTGFAKLAYDNNIPIIPVHGANTEFMVFQPIIYIANLLYITKLYDWFMCSTNNSLYKALFFIKMACIVICGSLLVIPIPKKIHMHIGEHIYKRDNEDLLTFTKRCEYELNNIIKESRL